MNITNKTISYIICKTTLFSINPPITGQESEVKNVQKIRCQRQIQNYSFKRGIRLLDKPLIDKRWIRPITTSCPDKRYYIGTDRFSYNRNQTYYL